MVVVAERGWVRPETRPVIGRLDATGGVLGWLWGNWGMLRATVSKRAVRRRRRWRVDARAGGRRPVSKIQSRPLVRGRSLSASLVPSYTNHSHPKVIGPHKQPPNLGRSHPKVISSLQTGQPFPSLPPLHNTRTNSQCFTKIIHRCYPKHNPQYSYHDPPSPRTLSAPLLPAHNRAQTNHTLTMPSQGPVSRHSSP